MLGLVLCGGGAKGSYEIGVWKALIDMDIKIDVVTGNSIGALNAALVAQGDFKKALDLWYNFDAGKMLGVKNYEDLEITAKTANAIVSLAKDFYSSGGSDALEYKGATALPTHLGDAAPGGEWRGFIPAGRATGKQFLRTVVAWCTGTAADDSPGASFAAFAVAAARATRGATRPGATLAPVAPVAPGAAIAPGAAADGNLGNPTPKYLTADFGRPHTKNRGISSAGVFHEAFKKLSRSFHGCSARERAGGRARACARGRARARRGQKPCHEW